jgi:hypothetical protein
MDFYTNIAQIEADTYDEPPPKNRWEAFWQWLVSDRVESFCMRSLIAFYIDVRGRYLRCDQLQVCFIRIVFLISKSCHIVYYAGLHKVCDPKI